jgi:UDP-2,3-diacylglucosamine pyrophosphatase LpxH
VSFISNFEETAIELAIDNEFDYVVCGHIHHPTIKAVKNGKGSCVYLNSGDWVENLTALEYHNEQWQLYVHSDRQRFGKDIISEENEDDSLPDLLSAFVSLR